MKQVSNITAKNQLTTDDLPFSAYLKMKGYQLLRSDQQRSKSLFVFNVGADNPQTLKVEFINSEFLNFYNELRNMKKLILY